MARRGLAERQISRIVPHHHARGLNRGGNNLYVSDREVYVDLSPAELALEDFYTRTYSAQLIAGIGSILCFYGVATYFHIISLVVTVIWPLAFLATALYTVELK
jgi:hypothetical protein